MSAMGQVCCEPVTAHSPGTSSTSLCRWNIIRLGCRSQQVWVTVTELHLCASQHTSWGNTGDGVMTVMMYLQRLV